MSQIKIYGIDTHLIPLRKQLSDTIHNTVVHVLSLPIDKRFHRFFPLESANFFKPEDRSDAYTIIEISMIKGRSVQTKKALVKRLFENIENDIGIQKQDIEITIYEEAPENWGFRGAHGDEITLSYKVEI